ncbi:LacI family DNA-binding transcriptional regulator [Phytoactinopolyspora endophytica]|uniref:LacI family DNA-binding transcriptional regulator n=1 Tax=Phytoactinopolyspora endophytica TaxID=1642495 RepID=UPI00101D9499|nr:LacI family DNA-binding transcriptional regulator [Phytoactinopolyspora endophytica]
MKKQAGRATLKDVAEAAGVSISTVSRAFSSPERLSPSTVQHVKEVAARLRFSVNPVAKALITGTSMNIGLVVPDITNPYMSTLLKAAQTHSRGRSIGVFAADTDDSARIEREVCHQLAQQTRGIILCGSRMSVPHIRELSEMIPLVLVSRVVEGIPSLYTGSTPALEELVDELVDLGHRRIAYLSGPAQSWANKQRSRAVSRRVTARGAEFVKLPPTTASYGDGRAAAGNVVESGATAVMAFDDVLASGLVEGLRRLGRLVPDDVSVTGHDDVLAELVYPGITTITGQSARVGQLAVDWLLEEPAAEGDTGTTRTEAVEGRVVRRGSVAAPP